jgi:D-alanine-D-alanine ligase
LMTPAQTNVTVMLGGPSAEREVSLRSGKAVARALRKLAYPVHELDPQDEGWDLPVDTTVVFLALHGTYGEDGTLQTRLDSVGVPYTGCGPAASRLAFDKVATKRRFEAAAVETPPWTVIETCDAPWPAGWEAPVIIKPVRQGSSVGLSVVEDRRDWGQAITAALRHDSAALVEQRVEGRELTVGLVGGDVLPIVEVRPREGMYDYRNKYTPGATEYTCPAALSGSVTGHLEDLAREAFEAVGARDYARVDVMLDGDERPWVLEVNTLPGMTETSLLPMAAAAAGISFGALCEKMIALALCRARGD